MDPLKIIQMVMKPDQLKDKVTSLCTADNLKTVVSMLTATTALGLMGVGAHTALSKPKKTSAPWLWVVHQHGELWQQYAQLRRTLRPKLRGVLDATVRRSMEWLMVMQASPPEHFHTNTVATATRRLRTAENGLLTIVGASGVPWSVRSQASLTGTQRRVAMPALERPARAVGLLRTALEVMYRNVVQLCRSSMVSNVVRYKYRAPQAEHSDADSAEGAAPAGEHGAAQSSPRAARRKPWHPAYNAESAEASSVRAARAAQSDREYIAATAHARIMRRLQQARAAR